MTSTPTATKKWASLEQSERIKAYYYWHIQMAGDLTEVAEELYTSVEVLEAFAEDNGLPVFDYDPRMSPRQRHMLAMREVGRVRQVVPKRAQRVTVYMEVALIVAQRSTCLSDQNGAVIVVDNRIVATGYNGAPAGKFHCNDIGVCRKELYGFKHFDKSIPGQLGAAYEVSRSVHAEQSAICACAAHGIAINGGEIYVTREPCVICLRMIINCGIVKIYFQDRDVKQSIRIIDSAEAMI